MTDDDWDYACHLCGSLRCGCTPEDLAAWRESLKPKTAVVTGIEKIRTMSDYDIACRNCDLVYNGRGCAYCPGCGYPPTKNQIPPWA